MTVFDIAVLVIAGIFVAIGLWKGFLKAVLGWGAWLLAALLSRMLGGWLGDMLLPELIKGDGAIGSRLSSDMLDNINRSIASTVGTVIIFVVLLIAFKLIAKVAVKAVINGFKAKWLDKLLGALLGLVLAAGAVYALAFVTDIIAVLLSLIAPSLDIYGAIDNSVIFKYFF